MQKLAVVVILVSQGVMQVLVVLVEVEAGIVTQQPITALLVPDISLGMAAVLLVAKVDEVEPQLRMKVELLQVLEVVLVAMGGLERVT